jgi:RNA recognition motif-containing protein
VPEASETVFIGNLFFDLTAEDLRKHMEKYGTVMKAYIVHDARGISKG